MPVFSLHMWSTFWSGLIHSKTSGLQDIDIDTRARPHLQLCEQGPLFPVVLHLCRWLQQIAVQVFPVQHILSMACHDPVKKFVKLLYAHFWKRKLCLEDVTRFYETLQMPCNYMTSPKKVRYANLATEIWFLLNPQIFFNFWKCHYLWYFEYLFPAKHNVFTSYTTAPLNRN